MRAQAIYVVVKFEIFVFDDGHAAEVDILSWKAWAMECYFGLFQVVPATYSLGWIEIFSNFVARMGQIASKCVIKFL
jgi:hypothetical protein